MDGEVTIKTSLDTKSFDAQIRKVEEELNDLERAYKLLKETEPANSEILKTYAVNIEKAKNKLIELNKKQLELNQTPVVDNKIGETIGENVKKMGKWALAVFSVRSAYNGIRNAVSILTGQNEELANKINFIKTSLANVLEPVVSWLVNQAYKLVTYVAYILKAWFGIDILAKKSNKSMNNTNKSAMKLRKTLAGFDEMNILQDNVASSGSSGLGDTFKGLDKVDIPQWVKDIAENKDKILDTLKRIGIELALIGGTAWFIKLAGDAAGLWVTFQKLSSNLKGITLLKGGLTAVAVALGAIAAVELAKIISESRKLSDEISNLVNVTEELNKSWKKKTDAMQEDAMQGKLTTEQEKKYADALLSTIHNNDVINDGIQKQSKLKQILTGTYKENSEIIAINNEEILDNLNKLKELYNQGKLTNEQKEKYTKLINVGIKALEKQNESLDKNSEEYKKNNDKIKSLRNEFEKITGSTYVAKLKVDADTKPANKTIGGFLKDMGSSLFSTLFPKLNFANTLKKFKFAKGGIINMPGRGVPLLNAVGGERGQEGIVPLTDSQQMELLGRSIGKYITLNATIITEMNGRVIGRELKKVDTDNDFATNN